MYYSVPPISVQSAF